MSISQFINRFVLAALALGCSFLVVACGERTPMLLPADNQPVLIVRIAKTKPFPGAEEIVVNHLGIETLYVSKEAVLTENDLKGTGVSRDHAHEKSWRLELFLTKAGSDRFARDVQDNLGQHAAIFVNGRLVLAPVLNDAGDQLPIMMIYNGFTHGEAMALAKHLVGR